MKSLREQKKRKNFVNKKTIIVACVLVAILLIVGGGWFVWQSRNASIPATPTVAENEAAVKTETQPQSEVAPADTNENSESAKNGESTSTTPTAQSGKKQVTPSLTFAGYADAAKQQVEVDAFVQGVLEDGGTCTVTATKGGQKVTAQSTGRANVSQTRCENIIVDRSKFPSGGTWSVVVAYESATASGSSAPQNMEL